jgi:5-methylcytosine-specific restriction endonuclease McrA
VTIERFPPPKPRQKRTGTYSRLAAQLRALANASPAFRCPICQDLRRPNDDWVVDHIVPRAHGGSDDATNLRVVHRSCNGRRNQTFSDWPT